MGYNGGGEGKPRHQCWGAGFVVVSLENRRLRRWGEEGSLMFRAWLVPARRFAVLLALTLIAFGGTGLAPALADPGNGNGTPPAHAGPPAAAGQVRSAAKAGAIEAGTPGSARRCGAGRPPAGPRRHAARAGRSARPGRTRRSRGRARSAARRRRQRLRQGWRRQRPGRLGRGRGARGQRRPGWQLLRQVPGGQQVLGQVVRQVLGCKGRERVVTREQRQRRYVGRPDPTTAAEQRRPEVRRRQRAVPRRSVLLDP